MIKLKKKTWKTGLKAERKTQRKWQKLKGKNAQNLQKFLKCDKNVTK